MAVVSYQQILDGANVNGKFGESLVATERWQIRTDSPNTTRLAILQALASGGIVWGAAHPDFAALKALEFDLASEGREGMRWLMTVKYYIPPEGKKPPATGQIPADVWELSASTVTVPAFEDTSGVTLCNAAGDPLEGLEGERHEWGWTLRKSYTTQASFDSAMTTYAGALNSATWAGGAAKTWKCYFRGAKKVSITKLDGAADGATQDYIEANWEFKYNAKTWKLMPWDVGFMELVSGSRKAILDSQGRPVKQPVALNTNGTKRSDGSKPLIANGGAGFDVYLTADFSTGFGSPTLL